MKISGMRLSKVTRSTARVVTVAVMAVAVITATADGFAQSYSGLYHWALEHQLAGWKAESFPLLVDLFILVGELGLFLLALDGHRLRKAFLPWVDLMIPASVASAGWIVSLVFNVGHVHSSDRATQVTAGVPPITAMVGLLILLRTLHRYMAAADSDSETNSVAPVFVVEQLQNQVRDLVLDTAPQALPEPKPADVPLPRAEMDHDEIQGWNAAMPTEPESTPEPAAQRRTAATNGDPTQHAEWWNGVGHYLESVSGGNPLSQRQLATRIGMRNRVLAAQIITYVKSDPAEAERMHREHANHVSTPGT